MVTRLIGLITMLAVVLETAAAFDEGGTITAAQTSMGAQSLLQLACGSFIAGSQNLAAAAGVLIATGVPHDQATMAALAAQEEWQQAYPELGSACAGLSSIIGLQNEGSGGVNWRFYLRPTTS